MLRNAPEGARPRQVLITGVAGFLGSHLAERCLLLGHEVLGVDNLLTGAKRNIWHLLPETRFEFVRHDVTIPLFVEVDAIFNLACPASPYWYQRNPVQTLKTSILGTTNMLGLAKRTGAKVIQASTSEVYGDPMVTPQSERYWGNVNPVGPRSCYDEGKRAAETLCYDYRRQYSVDARIARIFNTYGPRMAVDDGRVVSNFIVQALLGNPLTVYGTGEQSRSFCFVDDLIDGLLKLSDAEGDLTTPVNLGSSEEVTMLDLADMILDLTNSSSKIEFWPLPVDDPTRRRPDPSRAAEVLGWEASTPLEAGIRRTISYFEEVL